jgi:hypothetical protein
MRFHRGRDVIDLPPDTPIEGLEFSPTVRTLLLSSGAVFYASLVGLFVLVHVHCNSHSTGDERLETYAGGEYQTVARWERVIDQVRIHR